MRFIEKDCKPNPARHLIVVFAKSGVPPSWEKGTKAVEKVIISDEGDTVGTYVGLDGATVGSKEGDFVGILDGAKEGLIDGFVDGLKDGFIVGFGL